MNRTYAELADVPAAVYDIVYADPPWHYPTLDSPTRVKSGGYRSNGASGATVHYSTIRDSDMVQLPVRQMMAEHSALFMWATCPRLDFAIECIRAWGLNYRGMAYIWLKTSKETGDVLGAIGPPPAFVKPVAELVLVATTIPRGRVFPLLDYKQRQVHMAPRGGHSEKPAAIRDKIVDLCGDRSRIELFARQTVPGWDACGHGLEPAQVSTTSSALDVAAEPRYMNDGQGLLYMPSAAS